MQRIFEAKPGMKIPQITWVNGCIYRTSKLVIYGPETVYLKYTKNMKDLFSFSFLVFLEKIFYMVRVISLKTIPQLSKKLEMILIIIILNLINTPVIFFPNFDY